MDKNEGKKNAPIVPRCKKCGLKIRSKNHEDGAHHQNKVPRNGHK